MKWEKQKSSSLQASVVGGGGRGGAGFGNGILQVGWPDNLEEETQAPVLLTAERAEEANSVAAARRHEKEKEKEKERRKAQLDPRRSFYYPYPNTNPSEGARGGGGEEAEAHTKHVSATQPGSHFNTPSTSTSSPSATASSAEYALFSERMADTSHSQSHGHVMGYSFTHNQEIPQPQTVSRVTQTSTRMRGGVGGEIVAVQGGHIVRSTGRKDRHSKVCTAKGPRDRRVRLSAHTAIQFYDVQDRLGYDRPSKAVDWLMKNAKDAIDKLAELPAWTPTTGPITTASITAVSVSMTPGNQLLTGVNPSFDFGGGGGNSSNNPSGGFLPPSLDSDAIADTIKSFFPLGAASASGTNQTPSPAQTIGFQTYAHEPLQRTTSNQNQDLRLSLQSFQDPIYHSSQQHHGATFAGSGTNLGYSSGSGSTLWPDPNQIMQWSMADGASGSGGGAGGGGVFSFSMPQQASQQAVPMQVLGQSQLFLQRGPLQSSNSPSVRSWAESISSESDHQMHPGLYESIGFRSGGSSFSGFRIPARIHGEEEEHGGLSDRPPSASRH